MKEDKGGASLSLPVCEIRTCQVEHCAAYQEEPCTHRHSYHGVIWLPFGTLVRAKLGRRLGRLDVADYQDTGLRRKKKRV